jgi:hypothetical protein
MSVRDPVWVVWGPRGFGGYRLRFLCRIIYASSLLEDNVIVMDLPIFDKRQAAQRPSSSSASHWSVAIDE